MTPLPFDAAEPEYRNQATTLLADFRAGDGKALQLVRTKLPRFLDETIPWLPKPLSDAEIRSTPLDTADAELAVARWYDFRDWAALSAYAAAVGTPGSPVHEFESTVEAVVNGDTAALAAALQANPALVHARSSRVTHFDPPVHRATLLHYIAANGVENHRQKTPANAVEISRLLFESGAAPDALADMYGGQSTTMSMLVSSGHPAAAGVQVALIDTLVDFGASVEGHGTGNWTSPLLTALAFSFTDAAEALARRGARVDTLAAAAGLGRLDRVRELLPSADPEDRHRALSLAAQMGHAEIVGLLLESGEDPNRYNPKSNHPHSTPLHQAALNGHADVVRLFVEHGARLDIEDKIYHGTPQGWAAHGGHTSIAEYLAQAAKNPA